MAWKTTSVFDENLEALVSGFKIIVNKGGTRSGKTWAVLQLLYIIAERSRKPLLVSVVSETLPHLKKGCIRDFQTMLQDEGKWNEADWNATDKIYRVRSSTIEFFGCDSPAKVHGPARDILFVNECQNVKFDVFRQLEVRTRRLVLLDYNPTALFWVDTHVMLRESVRLIHSTYLDNTFLTGQQVAAIEAGKDDEQWWKVYGLGETGTLKGLIYENWEQCAAIPEGARLVGRGLDFGFTIDPSAVVAVYQQGGELWIDEELYQPGLTNDRLAAFLKDKDGIIVADSAEMKSIAELRNFGVRWIEPAKKGPDSVRNGIQIVQRYKLNVTKASVNLIRELRNYKWAEDKATGELLNAPAKNEHFDHALDALRYLCINRLAKKRSGGARAYIGRLY